MYAALLSNGEMVYASQVSLGEEDVTYYCPICQQPVVFKRSHRGNPFFCHLRACGSASHQRSTRESPSHQAAKQLIHTAGVQSGIETNLEVMISDDQIADVLLKRQDDQAVVIECQCSPISSRQLQQRTDGYCDHQLEVHWLLDESSFQQQRLTQWHKRCLQYDRRIGFYWQTFDLQARQLCLNYQLPLMYHRGHFGMKQQVYHLDQLKEFLSLSLIPEQAQKQSFYRHSKRYDRSRRLASLQCSTDHRQIVEEFYLQEIALELLPDWILSEKWELLLVTSASWVVFALCYLYFLTHQQEEITKDQLIQEIKRWQTRGWVQLVTLPLAPSQCPSEHLAETLLTFLTYWEMIGWNPSSDSFCFISFD